MGSDQMVQPDETYTDSVSLVELLRHRAARAPDSALCRFLADGEDGAELILTTGGLDLRARALATRLQERGLAGGRALLLYPPGLEFIAAFFGCLYAGVVAVPAHVPRPHRPMPRLRSIVEDARPSVVLTCASLRKDSAKWSAAVPGLEGVAVLCTDEEAAEGSEDDERAGRWVDPGATAGTLAFLQYTSGSTATPRGVMITHGNLLDNSARIQSAFGSSHEGRGVSWLPLFHDMGLIGGMIQTLYCGGSSTLLSPVSILQRPLRWLEAISRTGATISGGPNFAYDLCVEKTTPEQRAGLDLSRWRVAFNGAEPIRAETLDRFAEAFAPAGFRPEAFLPCYGLAEATLLVSANRRGRRPVVLSADAESLGRGEVANAVAWRASARLVSSGRAADGHVVAIVDPATSRPCPEDRVGEIWVSGPSVAQGYWNRPEESREVMGALLIGEGDRSFLRTGDLGFLRDGELFVTGRIKDMIILRGRNVYPQDVEWAAESCHPALRAGGAAAFSIEAGGEERLAIVLEVERRLPPGAAEAIFAAVRREVAEALDLEVYAIRLIKMTTLPRTSSGKVQRHACREAFLAGSLETVAEWMRPDMADAPAREARAPAPASRGESSGSSVSRDAITAWLAAKVAEPLGVRPDDVDSRAPLATFGIGSLQAVGLAAELEEWLGRKLSATLVYDYPTIDALAGFLAGESAVVAPVRHANASSTGGREPIAIIGIGCRFPGADGPAAFWELLRTGAEAIGDAPDSRWTEQDLRGLHFPRRGGFLESIDRFDADFFRIAPREAIFLDPQQRMLLEVAWEALEDGGQVPDRLAGTPVAVYIGISTNDYSLMQVKRGGAAMGHRITGNAGSIAANRISHFFDFRGPSLAIDTACSSSLVATHLACRSLWDGESELALVGGANLLLQAQVFAGFAKSGFLSPDGHCKAFDAQANGYVRGEGAGMVVLKPLSRALSDGDPIYAVICGGAVNQDGRTNGLTAPSRSAQEAVLRSAFRHAGIAPGLVDYVEAHGTGTPLGDPIELAALGSVLAEGRAPGRPCALGSVKTNLGHLEAAAGIAGLIKTALALRHRAIPPSLHFSRPNPHVAYEDLPVRVQRDLDAWPDTGRPALAGVSAFGFGGTNAHLILEEAPAGVDLRPVADGGEPKEVIIPLSAQSPAALWDLADAMRSVLRDGAPELDLRDVAYTAGARRGHLDHRLALVVSSRDEAIEALDSFRRGEPHWSIVQGRRIPGRRPGVVFVFPGTSGLWRGAGRALLQREPVFQAVIERCDAILRPLLGWSPAAELMAEEPSSRVGDASADRALHFSLEVALTALWESWGIVPTRVVGDGIGEVVAAYVAGTMSLEDAARIAAGAASETARFPDAIAELADEGLEVFLELGSHPVLAPAIKQCLGSRERASLILASLRRGDAGLGTMRSSAAFLYARGFDIEWSRVSPAGRFVRLPNYPWQRERFWLDEEGKLGKSFVAQEPDGVDDTARTVPHQDGPSNGHCSSPIERHAEPVARRSDDTDRLIEFFRDRVAAVLGLTPDKVDPDRSLMTMGLDSLTAMELKVEIDTGLGTVLPLSMLMEGTGIRELAGSVSEHLKASPAPSPETSTPPASGESDHRLSHGQQMLWYAHQFAPTGAAYHITGAATIRATLDRDAFRRAIQRVIGRQDALRTTFAVVDERPAIRLLDAGAILHREDEWLPLEDAASLDEAGLQDRLVELSRRPFDLETGPLFRLHLLRRGESEHVVLLVVHHIIADFWSTAVLVDDLAKAYAEELAGCAGDPAPPTSSYADFTRWQHGMVAGAEGERHWDYWRQQLTGPLPVLDLPIDFARPAVRSYQGAVKHFHLDADLTRAVVALGESRGASLFMTLLAAFQVFLGRYSGQDDVLVGSPVAGRTRPGLEGLIGYFVNMLPMRGDLSGNPPFDDFLGRVRRTVAGGLEHQDFPFGLMVNRLQANADPGRPPLFQVMYAHQKAQRLDEQGLAPFALGIAGARLDLHGLGAESIALDKGTALFDLAMMTALEGDRLAIALEYSTDLFGADSIDRMADGFRTLLEAIVAGPGRRLADLPMVPDAERHRLLGSWAEAPAIPHADVAIHHRFERQAEHSPGAVALVWGDESLTYDELNRSSNRLAYRLVDLGVGPETVVGLHLERWPSRVIGLLAVLKAGGAYLPMDPDHPAERLASIVQDSGASLVVTEDRLRERLPACEATAVRFEALLESSAEADPGNPSVRVDGGNLAYVVYTSGSTGRPKGVMVSHRSLLTAASAWEDAYDLRRPPLRHLQAAGFAFDVFTGDWVRALTTGGILVECPRRVLLDPAALAELIRRERIECLELVPAVADALAAHVEEQDEDLAGIRLMAVGSDTMRGRLYGRLCRLVGRGGRVVNSYGLTETTIDSACYAGSPENLTRDGQVPIGRPLPGTRVYVLDGRGEPVPAGVVGELYIGGPGVARGYVNHPGQTAERFLPDPYAGPGSRMYATGDRARWRDGGVMELLGRRDGQVKVRGFRIELAEVEAVLTRHTGVSEAVVVAHGTPLGEKRLTAYVVPAIVSYPTTSELRRWLRDRMPEPMVPSSYVFLEALPLSPNGKLDRSALRPPAMLDGDGPSSRYVPPRTIAEEILAGITADLLGRDRVGVDEDFFAIGIDSILGIQMVSRARQAGLSLDPAQLFRCPNVAELAAATDAGPDHRGSSEVHVFAAAPFEVAPEGLDIEAIKLTFAESGGIEDLYPLTPVQEGMLYHTLADPEAGRYVEQFLCRLRGELDLAAFRESWRRVVARHPALRSSIHWTDLGESYQMVHTRADQPLEDHDWRGLTAREQDERLRAYLASDRRRGFIPSRPPLSRLALLRLREDEHQLIWSIHHVVIDGWCLSILLHEVIDIYEAIRRGREPESQPGRPFRDYVAWLRDRDDGHAERHWRQSLGGVTAATPLGVDDPSPNRHVATNEAVAECQIQLSTATTAAIQSLGRSHRLTLSTVIQGAWAMLLSRYSGRDDVLFGVTVSGRPPELTGVESMVGMFINVLPLRARVIEECELIPWLRELQATMLELRRFEAIPLSKIQAWSEVPPGLPLFESIVIVQNLPFVGSLQERAGRLGIESARYLERTHYPIAVTVLPGTELEVRIGYDADRFDPAIIEHALGHLRTLLEAMATRPEGRLAELTSLIGGEPERRNGPENGSRGEPQPDDLDLDRLTADELDSLIAQLR